MDRLRTFFSLMLLLVLAAAVRAEAPRVHFDMPFTIACRDVTPCEFGGSYPGQRLIEARFEISSLLLAGQERDLTQYFIRIDSPQRTLAVVDYLPKTLHEKFTAGPVSIQDTDERSASIGINFSGKYELFTGAGVNAGLGQKNVSCVKYDLLPPLETVAASGTLLRGSAVFFKLKASPRHLLEGSREFGIVFRVASDWRADYVDVTCLADGIERSVVSTFNEQVRCGRRELLVALYQEGDESARLAAEEFARCEASLRATSSLRSVSVEKEQASSPTLAARMGLVTSTPGKSKPAATPSWIPSFLQSSSAPAAETPEAIAAREAAADFATARERVASLSGSRPSRESSMPPFRSP